MNIVRNLAGDFAQHVVREFGIEAESDDAKAYLVGQLAENISGRVLLEATKLIPDEKQVEFSALAEGTDADAIERFLAPYIPDFQSFVRSETHKEIERTKAYMFERLEAPATGEGQCK
ncbi:hypothetical protein HY413_03460 [Candidatus Kaiserbacteria bacterium]|nr:hypothetical protein [Candidatus Kaiserbacteria bacterium]